MTPKHPDDRRKRPSKITVPERANPLAKLVFAEMKRQGVTYADLEWKAGVIISTFKAWRTDNAPGLTSISAALGALGWTLVPVPDEHNLPPDIRDGLQRLAKRWHDKDELRARLLLDVCRPRLIGTPECPAPNPVPGSLSQVQPRVPAIAA